jgi:hypothetical protein
METVVWITVASVCLVVGIYFFFVRTRPAEKPNEQQ